MRSDGRNLSPPSLVYRLNRSRLPPGTRIQRLASLHANNAGVRSIYFLIGFTFPVGPLAVASDVIRCGPTGRTHLSAYAVVPDGAPRPCCIESLVYTSLGNRKKRKKRENELHLTMHVRLRVVSRLLRAPRR